VFPSPIDQAPNAVLEAMAAATPVVALRVGAVPEMVEDGVTGLLVDEDDDEALLAAIGRLLDDGPAAAAMGARGRERAQARYDIDRTTAALVQVLGEAASSRGGRSRP
jgi:starch synthase